MKKLISFCCEFTLLKLAAAASSAAEEKIRVLFID
jgi:hypothetical protein